MYTQKKIPKSNYVLLGGGAGGEVVSLESHQSCTKSGQKQGGVEKLG